MSKYVQPRNIFPGRVTLYLHEVARFLRGTEQDVLALIAAGKLRAADIRDLTGMKKRFEGGPRFQRVPIEALEEYLKAEREEQEREE